MRRPQLARADGALPTHLAAPEHAARMAEEARAAQALAQRDVRDVAAGVATMAAALHEHTRRLEQAVEGTYAGDASDPRVRLLAETLEIARRADLRLAQLGDGLRRVHSSVAASQEMVDALQRERERLTLLYQIAQELNSTIELDDVLGSALARLIEVVRAERGYVMLWDAASGALRRAAARGMDVHSVTGDEFAISLSVVNQVWATRQPMLTTDAQRDQRLRAQESVVAFGIHSVMCAPLLVRGRGVGVVYVDSRIQTHLFDDEHLDLLAALCNQVAIAIDNARLFTDLRQRIGEISAMKTYTDNIFSSIASGVITTDHAGSITAFNRAAERILRVAEATALGHSYRDVLVGLGDTTLTEMVTRATEHGETTLGQVIECELPERGEVSLRLNTSALRAGDGAGEPLGVAMVVDDLTELRRSQRQAREIESLFGRYVHPAVVRQLLADPRALNLGGEIRTISVLFADIRGYTRLAEESSPHVLVAVLNRYLEILTEAIWREEGTVTMFIGDALMAIFNAPLPQEDHTPRAVRAALGMRTALEREHERTGPHPSPISYGIGVTTGEALVGNIGARERLQNYTAIGDAVNTAQRLESSATANQILLSAPAYVAVADWVHARELAPLVVKGKSLPLPAYELLSTRARG
jgi:PAS domain S-box-containing protein